MHAKMRLVTTLVAAGLALSAGACGVAAPSRPKPPPPSPGVAVPSDTAAAPRATSTPHLPPQAGLAATPAATTPSPTRWAGPLPPDVTALVAVGSEEHPQLQALGLDGSLTDLGWELTPTSLASPGGRWVVRLDRVRPASAVIVRNLANGATHTILLGVDCGSGLCIAGHWAFDAAGERLAFLEVGSPGAGWGLVVVDLRDGEASRFPVGTGVAPGVPLGWAAGGDELLLATFRPFAEAGWWGVSALRLPPRAGARPEPRQLLPLGACNSVPRLSPDGTRLLYLARNPGYAPAGYKPDPYDTAVNQLWALGVADSAAELLWEAADGGALAGDAAWSPDGSQVLFAEGRYEGSSFASLTLKVRETSGAMRDVGALPPGRLWSLAWCRPHLALAVTAQGCCLHRLHAVDLEGAAAGLVVSERLVAVLACVP